MPVFNLFLIDCCSVLGSQSDLKEMGTASHLILEIVDDFFIQD